MHVRVGINTGEVTRRGGDLFGQAVNAAARVLACAEPGQILVSRVVKDLVGTLPDVVFVDRGSVSLKGFADPWTIYEVDWRAAQAHERLRVRLLGNAELGVGTTAVGAFASARLQSLLGFLIVHRDSPQPRERVAVALWPDLPEAQARAHLRQALHILRQALPEPDRFLRADSRTVQWAPEAPADVDVALFESAQGAEGSAAREELERAALLYGGDLLPGCRDGWVEPERQRLRRLYAHLLEQLATLADEQGDGDAAVGHAQRLLELDPLDESTYRRLMRLHARAGERARALVVYHACVSALGRELGVSPSAETAELYERLIADSGGSAGVRPATAEVAAVPVIGRDREWDQLVRCWQATAEGRAQLVLVRGEAGIGKSRLVEDFRAWCARQGVSTASARVYEAEGSLSYAPVIDVLRSQAVRPALARLDAVWLSEIARLLPELLVEHGDLPSPGPLGPNERTRLFEALARAIAPAGVSLALVVDDLQWCDADTLQFLHFLVRFSPGARLLVLATAREEDVGPEHPLHAVVAGLRAMDALVEVPLGRLDAAAARALAEALVGDDEATLRRVVESSEGNPLFLVEIARSGLAAAAAEAGSGPAVLPMRVQAVIEARLAKLPDPAGELVGAASVVGRAFSVDVVRRLLRERSDDDVVAAIDELSAARDRPGARDRPVRLQPRQDPRGSRTPHPPGATPSPARRPRPSARGRARRRPRRRRRPDRRASRPGRRQRPGGGVLPASRRGGPPRPRPRRRDGPQPAGPGATSATA